MIKLLAAALCACTLTCMAQNAEVAKYYKLDFVVKEVDGTKVVNSRAYSMTVSTLDKTSVPSSIRAGSKIPAPSPGGDGKQLQFFETGVNIDCRSVKDNGSLLTMIVNAEVSSALQESPASGYPVIRQYRWASPVVVTLNRPTVLFSSDDTATKHQLQLALTASAIQ